MHSPPGMQVTASQQVPNTLLRFTKLTFCLGDRDYIFKAAMVHFFLELFPQISALILSSFV